MAASGLFLWLSPKTVPMGTAYAVRTRLNSTIHRQR
jgi:hypothetical protein